MPGTTAKMVKKPVTEESEDWLITYADAITLLMAFFVLLNSVSKIELPLIEKLQAGISEGLFQEEAIQPITLLEIDIDDILFSHNAESFAELDFDEDGIVIEFQNEAFFESGSTTIRTAGAKMLQEIAQTLLSPRYETYTIDVEGHTDSTPIATALFPSNWELSASRATNVVRFLIDQGVRAERMKAVGFSSTQPKYPDSDEAGNPVPENQARNRRLTLRVHPRRF